MDLTDLAGFYDLSEESGAAVDAHNDNDLTEGGSVAGAGSGAGRVFNTSTDELIGAISPSLGDTGSIMFWVKPDSVNNDQYIMDAGGPITGANNKRACILGFQDGHYNLFNAAYPTGTASDTQMAATGAGSWDFVVWTFNGTTVKGYVNGSEIVSVSASVNNTITEMTLGHTGSVQSNNFAGVLRRVGFWNRGVSGAEVTTLWNGGAGLSYAEMVSGGAPAGQPITKRSGGVPHMGTGGLKGGFGGGAWGRTRDHVYMPRWLADHERQAA
jgi:hypothetical protein